MISLITQPISTLQARKEAKSQYQVILVKYFLENYRVTCSGDCCFSLFSSEDGLGSNQVVGPEGDYHLQMDHVRSVFRINCEEPLIHPVLKYFLIVLGIIIVLYFMYSKGKELLFRRRV